MIACTYVDSISLVYKVLITRDSTNFPLHIISHWLTSRQRTPLGKAALSTDTALEEAAQISRSWTVPILQAALEAVDDAKQGDDEVKGEEQKMPDIHSQHVLVLNRIIGRVNIYEIKGFLFAKFVVIFFILRNILSIKLLGIKEQIR